MIVTRVTVVLGVALYVGLWVLAINGATFLYAILLIPIVLVALVGFGAWLTRYMGLPTSASKFDDHSDDES